MAFAVGKQFVILLNMSKTNPEAQKLLDDLDNISQEDFNQRFGKLLGNNKSADKEPEVGDVDDLIQDAATDNLIENKDKTVDNPLKGVEPIDAETSFDQPKGDTKQTKSALAGIKGMDYKPTKYVYEKILPMRDTIVEVQNTLFEPAYKDRENTDFGFENSEEVQDIFYSDEVYEMLDDVLDNDAIGLLSSYDKYLKNFEEISSGGAGDSGLRRNMYLEDYYKDIYKPPSVLPKEDFIKKSKGKKVLYRGVGTVNTVANTLSQSDAFYMYQGARGDGIYMSEDKSVADSYSKLGDKTLMQFIVPDDFKTIDNTILEKIGARFKEKIVKKILELRKKQEEVGNVGENFDRNDDKKIAQIQKQVNELSKQASKLENFQYAMQSAGYTPLAIAMGFDAVETFVVPSRYESAKPYKNYIFLNLERLTALDIT